MEMDVVMCVSILVNGFQLKNKLKGMLLKLIINKGSYRDEEVYGLGNSLFNYIITNNLLLNDSSIKILTEQCLCTLKDDIIGEIPDFNDTTVYEIIISHKGNTNKKYAVIKKVIEFIKNMNTLFSDPNVSQIEIRRIKNAEIL